MLWRCLRQDCKQMYEYCFAGRYDTWEMTMFVLFLLALAYNTQKMYLAWNQPQYHRATSLEYQLVPAQQQLKAANAAPTTVTICTILA